jgi:type I restriction enzyme R subunit
MLAEIGGRQEFVARAARENNGLGLFVRSLVGLDHEAAKQAFAAFLTEDTHTADQIEFVNPIVDHLTQDGVMEPERLYESPFVDRHPLGVDGMFGSDEVKALFAVLEEVRLGAAA